MMTNPFHLDARPLLPGRRVRLGWLAVVILGSSLVAPAVARSNDLAPLSANLQRIFAGSEPQSLAELKAMQEHQQVLAKRLIACTVGIVVGPAHGSGVIISADGYVLTAAHVGGTANRPATFILPDGRRVRGKSLGAYRTLDAGLMKITEAGPWPYAEMAVPDTVVKDGQWCLATGHPGGFQEGREPVVRIGRVLGTEKLAITTDCTLVGGDSGGPLFDMSGKVIGINSRIGRALADNMHVPINAYQETWERLVKSEQWGNFPGTGPMIGVRGAATATDARLAQVYSGSPAEKAGLRPGDLIVAYDGKPVTDFASLQVLVNDSRPGDKVQIELLRGERRLVLELVVGQQGS